MFNGGDNRGFDLINHAIRMGTMEEVLRRNDLLRHLNTTNPSLLAGATLPPAQGQAPPGQQPAGAVPQRPLGVTDTSRLNPNAFQVSTVSHREDNTQSTTQS